MEGAISPCLFESFGRGIYGLVGHGKSAHSQHFDVLSVADFSTCIDHFLPGFEEFLGKLSELKNLSFNEWIAQSSHRLINELLVRLPVFEETLSERREG